MPSHSLRNSICLFALRLLLFVLRVGYICEIENQCSWDLVLYTVDIFLIISIEPIFIFALDERGNILCSCLIKEKNRINGFCNAIKARQTFN